MAENIEKVEEFIVSSLKDLKNLDKNKVISSRVIFPNYSDSSKSKRYSEQELKCIFINRVECPTSNFHYSVETPSKYKYRFVGEPKVWLSKDKPEEKFQSSMIDMSLYTTTNQENLISHIEFKHGQCPVFPIQKDFLKMIFESEKTEGNYFIHYLDKSNEKAKNAILKKYQEALTAIKKVYKNDIAKLNIKLEKIKVYVLFAEMEEGDNFFEFSLAENDIEHLKGRNL